MLIFNGQTKDRGQPTGNQMYLGTHIFLSYIFFNKIIVNNKITAVIDMKHLMRRRRPTVDAETYLLCHLLSVNFLR